MASLPPQETVTRSKMIRYVLIFMVIAPVVAINALQEASQLLQ